MQQVLPNSVGSSRSPYRSDLPSSSRTASDDPSSVTPPSRSSRVVVAEGSEFLLETVPRRGSLSAVTSPAKQRHLFTSQDSPTSSHLAHSSPTRVVSASHTPPRPLRADRPYRPPPSSSARFYERQTQRWMLDQPASLPPRPPRTQVPHHAPSLTPLQRDRSASVGSLAPPKPGTRSRSGSDASSFTRSRLSNGYQSTTDEESVDQGPYQILSPIFQVQASQAHTELRPRPNDASLASASYDDPTGLTRRRRAQKGALVDVALEASADLDWDAELGISDLDHAEPLRLPHLQLAEHSVHASPSTSTTSADASIQPASHSESINTANLKGIRVTSDISENWDEDFLFQNDEELGNAEADASQSSEHQGHGDHRASKMASGTRLAQAHNEDGAQSDNDVENWDDEFSWNADQMITPSSSTSSSSQIRMPGLNAAAHDDSVHGLRRRGNGDPSADLQTRSSRHPNTGRASAEAVSQSRLLQMPLVSQAKDASARLSNHLEAARSPARASQNRGGFSTALPPQVNHQNALGLVGSGGDNRRSLDYRGDDSGGDTETESPLKQALAPPPTRSARRSLGAALGFGTRPKAAPTNSANTSTHSPSGLKNKISSPSKVRTHTRSQSKPKVGALQRLSFSRSRLSVGNVSSTSINEAPDGAPIPQRPCDDELNQSQASVLTHVSDSSNRSQRGDSSASLENSFAALRTSSFRRLFGRGDRSGKTDPYAKSSRKLPPPSPPQRTSRIGQPILHVSSPTKDEPTALISVHSTSPPSAWSGLRRSIEVTPTRPGERSSRRGSDTLLSQDPDEALLAQARSDGRSPTLLGAMLSQTPWQPLQDPLKGPGRPDRRPSHQSKALDAPHNAGLRRDFSSSNTLRAASVNGPGNASTPTRSGRSAVDANTARIRQGVEGATYTYLHSDGADTYGGEQMLRHLGDRGSTSRSVSASTARSQTSSESLYGYRMLKQISVSSGPDALDSETSYGTSVASSPGIPHPSTWATHGKHWANTSTSTNEQDTSSSADLSKSQEISYRREGTQGCLSSASGSSFGLATTLDGAPSIGLSQEPRKQSTVQMPARPLPDTSMAQDASMQLGTLTPSPRRQEVLGTNADASAPFLPWHSPATSTVASSEKHTPRRNSLGDLKIPSRISKAQTGIRNNINLVRDFAKGIEELKTLKTSYMDHKTRTTSLSSDAEERVRNWLECADVLIGLGEGRSESDSAARVETVSHTPLSKHVESRRMTFSDASVDPRPSLDGPASRQPSLSGARSASGTSQATTSTTDGGRSVDVHREIDILSAILGGTTLAVSSTGEPRSHGRFQSETYSRGYPGYHSISYALATPQTKAATSRPVVSNLTTPKRNGLDGGLSTQSEQPPNTAPILAGVETSFADTTTSSEVDVGDINRSAKRRLRSASRAGLQGLRELLKGFKTGPSDTSGTSASKTPDPSQLDLENSGTKERSRSSTDGRPTTPSATKQKRKSLTLKRRSFLRSRTSLESMQVKDSDMLTAESVAPPLPVSPESVRTAHTSPPKVEQRRQGPTTREGGSADDSMKRPTSTSTKASRRVSLQPSLSRPSSSAKQDSLDMFPPAQPHTRQPLSMHLRNNKQQPASSSQQQSQYHRPSLVARATTSAGIDLDSRRASTSVDTLHRHHQPPLEHRPHSSTTAQSHSSTEQMPVVQKLALRPEAMPGLLVYVQATKQHLQAAIDEMGS